MIRQHIIITLDNNDIFDVFNDTLDEAQTTAEIYMSVGFSDYTGSKYVYYPSHRIHKITIEEYEDE